MTTAANCETRYEDGKTVPSTVRYALQGIPAALGFRLTVDGARFDLAPLDLVNEKVAEHLSSPGWRSLAFAAAVREDARLDDIANTFQRGWLTLVYQIAFALGRTGRRAQPPEQVHASLAGGRWNVRLPEILRVLYRDDSQSDTPDSTRREAELTELSKNEDVRNCIDEHGRLLWAADTPQLTAGLAQRSYRDTVAAAVLAAVLRACPDARERDLIVDVVPDPEDGGAAIWLTETSIGGLGLIEQLATYYAADPRRFWGLVDSALGPNDFEYVDATLTRLLEHVNAEANGAAAQAMARLRSVDVGARDRRGTAGPARRVGRDRRLPEAVSRLGAVSPATAVRIDPVDGRDGPRCAASMGSSAAEPWLRDRRASDRIRHRLWADPRARRGRHRLLATRFSAFCGHAATRHGPSTSSTTSRTLPTRCSTGFWS